ncbi:nitrogenase component 1 [Methanolobus halotolerans]|uniref:Nitrogenase associated protein N n=1 Tax=Methanolobus halotolerans TaxID=2052935 RepID=A0A4E0Q0A9_9EURY|nr:nitrogenase component 1 [Methanolobus halotolerans]TGC09752.1 nitrogenase associated protein N [Methanolobus halotolerans]
MTERNYSTVNPCIMCQPIGSVIAFKGIEDSMVLLHGSQGCSTYMRLHLAHHFQEPVDIGSSSLSEKGAVYGGSENLKKGLKNLILRYNPKVIGVSTTCLAETIGDDIGSIIADFREEEDLADEIMIIPVPTPSYEDSHNSGYIKAVEAIVKQFTIHESGNEIFNNKLNVVLSENISPEDTRELKKILSDTLGSNSFILLPDISETFDAPMTGKLQKIFPGGTTHSDIADMKNSAATIGLGITNNNKAVSYLDKTFEIPSHNLPLPIGLEYTDRLLTELSGIAGTDIHEDYQKERGRLIDAMVDAHKYVYGTKVAIYGDPNNVLGILSLALENGMHPLLVVASSKSPRFAEYAMERVRQVKPDCDVTVLEDVDFDAFNDAVKKAKPEMLIGNSNGKYISKDIGIPLVRIGFPIHDRVGAQRMLAIGYRGAMEMLDRITNTILEAQEEKLAAKWSEPESYVPLGEDSFHSAEA